LNPERAKKKSAALLETALIAQMHSGGRRQPQKKNIQPIKAASDRGAAALPVLTRSKFKRVFHRAWPDLQRMKLLLPVARSCRVSFFLA
jgi:hypothetical protein